jgi:hypothetical protein
MTYCLLVTTCLSLAWLDAHQSLIVAALWWALLLLSVVTFALNTIYIFHLSWGQYSSRAAQRLWKTMLGNAGSPNNELQQTSGAGKPDAARC